MAHWALLEIRCTHSLCWCPSVLLQKGHVRTEKDYGHSEKKGLDNIIEENPSSFNNDRESSFQVGNTKPELCGSRQNTQQSSLNILTLSVPFPWCYQKQDSRLDGCWALLTANVLLFFQPQNSKHTEICDSIHTSVFQVGKAFNCFQPGARAVPVTMKWKASHPILASHYSLVLSSFPCLDFGFLFFRL